MPSPFQPFTSPISHHMAFARQNGGEIVLGFQQNNHLGSMLDKQCDFGPQKAVIRATSSPISVPLFAMANSCNVPTQYHSGSSIGRRHRLGSWAVHTSCSNITSTTPMRKEKMVWWLSPAQELGISSSTVMYIMSPAVAAMKNPTTCAEMFSKT